MKQAFEECPKFITCSVNRCPLHPDYQNLESIPGDREQRCKLSKAKRLAIASRFPGSLVFDGMTVREYSHTIAQNRFRQRKSALTPIIQTEPTKLVSNDDLEAV